MEFGTLEGILGCVAVGLGWTLMPRRVVEQSAHTTDLVVETLPPEIAQFQTGDGQFARTPPMAVLKTLALASGRLRQITESASATVFSFSDSSYGIIDRSQ